MFRKLFISIFLLLTACSDKQVENLQSAPVPEHKTESQVLLIKGGKIITMDATLPIASAMAIENGLIIAIGNDAELSSTYANAAIIDLQGKTIIPGVIDSHAHVAQLGAEAIKANLVGTVTVEAMVDSLKAFYPNPAPGEWLLAQGWDEGVWASIGNPDRALIDQAFPNNPIKMQALHGFAGFYNGKALEIAGIDANTEDPQVGQILRRADGEPTGVMLTLAQDLVNKHVPPLSIKQIKKIIIAGLKTMSSAGVTSIHEAGMKTKNVTAFKELAAEKALPIRVYGMLDGNNEILMQEMFASGPIIDEDYFFTLRSVKVYYDGSLGSRTALLRDPYSDEPDKANMTERISPERVKSLADLATKNGFQMSVHAIGDEGNDRMLSIYEKALANYPDLDHRWRSEHAQVVLADYFPRAGKLGIISSMQPSHAVGDSKWAEDRLGSRVRNAYAWQKMLKANIPLLMNSDLPGEPWEPMNTLYFAVNRKTLDNFPEGGWYKEEALSVEQALQAMTVTGAYAAFQEDKLGQLSVGYFADFVELDMDPLTIPNVNLKDIQVKATWINGQKIWPEP